MPATVTHQPNHKNGKDKNVYKYKHKRYMPNTVTHQPKQKGTKQKQQSIQSYTNIKDCSNLETNISPVNK